jgi:hypothetical protein
MAEVASLDLLFPDFLEIRKSGSKWVGAVPMFSRLDRFSEQGMKFPQAPPARQSLMARAMRSQSIPLEDMRRRPLTFCLMPKARR